MKNSKFILPNSLTIINLILGCAAITVLFKGRNEYNASWLIILAAIFDMLDGLAARVLKARSEFGSLLDSLADIVSFGVAPALIIFSWFNLVLIELSEQSTFDLAGASVSQKILLLCSFLFAAAAALRLAKFNTSQQSDQYFRGLTTTASGLMVASLWLMINTGNDFFKSMILNIYFAVGVLVVLIFLMLSNIRMISLKFSGWSLKMNLDQYIIILAGLIMIILYRVQGIFFSMVFYLIYSILLGIFRKEKEA